MLEFPSGMFNSSAYGPRPLYPLVGPCPPEDYGMFLPDTLGYYLLVLADEGLYVGRGDLRKRLREHRINRGDYLVCFWYKETLSLADAYHGETYWFHYWDQKWNGKKDKLILRNIRHPAMSGLDDLDVACKVCGANQIDGTEGYRAMFRPYGPRETRARRVAGS